ncbi:MAG: COG1361 S-layer family protein [Halobacteriota archaeon]|nr:COG1361 S-layer family protein [Halobacteriota archaeon]
MRRKNKRCKMDIKQKNKIISTCLALFLMASIVSPSFALTASAPGEPDLDAIVYGSNELSPGESTQLQILIQNTGLLETFDTSISAAANSSLTAIDLTAELDLDSDVPITVKTEKVLVGALPSMYPYPPIAFSIEVDKDARPGEYTIPLVVKYKRLLSVYISDDYSSMSYSYTDEKRTIDLDIKIAENFDLLIEDIRTSNMHGGSNGNLELTIKNNGYETAYDTVLTINPTIPSYPSSMAPTPFTPTTSTYIGDVKPDESVKVNFEIAISNDAMTKEYPVQIVADYKDANSQSKQSTTAIFGILITEKSDFIVRNVEVSGMDAGGEGTITLTIENDGDETAYSSVASLNLKSPFSILDNTAFIGDLKPGKSKTAVFKVQIAEDASEKQYPLDAMISYEDGNHDKKIFTTATFGVPVEGMMDFEIVKVDADLEVGSKGLIEVTFKNIGSEAAKDSIARISATTPFSSTDDTAFLGTISPGETKVGKFQIKVDGEAIAKEYALNTEIKYSNEDDNTKVSDVMKAAFDVKPASTNVSGVAAIGLVVLVLIVLFIYYFKKSRK